jgi:hypothetical protein
MKLLWQLPLIVHIITKYKITHHQYLILHNKEFRSFGNRKNYFKSTTVTFRGTNISLFTLYRMFQKISDQVGPAKQKH